VLSAVDDGYVCSDKVPYWGLCRSPGSLESKSKGQRKCSS
jgi:hypothetical protein